MSDSAAETPDGVPEIRRLTFDLDVEVCVIGGGLAGLSVAREAASLGASVALLEARRVGWAASGQHLGAVQPGFDVSAQIIVARIGRKAASELWRMSQTGAEIVRTLASPMPGIGMTYGALEVSSSGRGERALGELLELGADFGISAELWTKQRLRERLDTARYFSALHDPNAFQIDSAAYLQGLLAAVRRMGVRVFEQTEVTAIDVSGNRKRIVTPAARLRASHVVLAGNVHLGAVMPRLTATLLPVWRYGAITAPLGERLKAAIDFAGSVTDTDGIDHFRALQNGQLIWTYPETTWDAQPQRFAAAIQRRIRRVFPGLGPAKGAGSIGLVASFGAAAGRTVHGMPQIGQLRPGLWIASGFGRKGMATTAMAGRIIAQGILYNDDRWRLFAPFDLVWAGGRTGRVAGYAIERASRGRAAALGAWARHNEAAIARSDLRKARAISVAADVLPAAHPAARAPEPETKAADEAPRRSGRDVLPPSPFLEMPTDAIRSQQSEHETEAPT